LQTELKDIDTVEKEFKKEERTEERGIMREW
jgi:hypothetical protein